MAKFASDDMLDGSLLVLKDNVTRQTLCNAQPTTFAEANATFALAEVTMASANLTIADGDTSGRKLTVAQMTGIDVDSSGTGNHVALLDVSGSRLLYVTTCTSQTVTAGNSLTINSWSIELADPS